MKEKLIEEMLEDICPNSLTSKCSLCWAHYECVYKQLARALVEKGYRKQTEVAREIFAEIEQVIQEKLKTLSLFKEDGDDFYMGETHALEKLLAELKNKYIGGVGE